MSDLTLSTAVRSSLLSLQSTTDLISRTQGRLSTGLRVASPVDDPVAYFQAKTLNDRAFDFNEKKNSIDQGVSTLTAALDGVNTIETLVRQLKGIANSMKSADSTQLADLVTQFNDLRTQIDNLAADASYQGSNLINGTGTTLTVEFSEKTASVLTVNSYDLTVATSGLNVSSAAQYDSAFVAYYSSTQGYTSATSASHLFNGFTTTQSISVTWEGPDQAYSGGNTVTFTYGSNSIVVTVNDTSTLTAGEVISIDVNSAATTASGFEVVASDDLNFNVSYASAVADVAANTGTNLVLTYNGGDISVNTANGSDFTFTYGTNQLIVHISETQTDLATLSAGEVITAALVGATTDSGAIGNYIVSDVATGVAGATTNGASAVVEGYKYGTATVSEQTAQYSNASWVETDNTDLVNNIIAELDSALTTIRSRASNLGSNVAVLQTRLDFTGGYVNTLESGGSKLTLADLNEEGANLLALQTRQQLGIQALAFAGQAEQGILALFR